MYGTPLCDLSVLQPCEEGGLQCRPPRSSLCTVPAWGTNGVRIAHRALPRRITAGTNGVRIAIVLCHVASQRKHHRCSKSTRHLTPMTPCAPNADKHLDPVTRCLLVFKASSDHLPQGHYSYTLYVCHLCSATSWQTTCRNNGHHHLEPHRHRQRDGVRIAHRALPRRITAKSIIVARAETTAPSIGRLRQLHHEEMSSPRASADRTPSCYECCSVSSVVMVCSSCSHFHFHQFMSQ